MISVVIPAFNEGDSIGLTVSRVREVMEQAEIGEFEILVVDDGSRDQTGAVATRAGATLISNPHNLGYGRSLKRGISAAQYDIIAITDADMTYPIERIPELLAEYHRGFDMVVGQRQHEYYRDSALKRPMRRILKFLVEYAAGRKIPDINSGLRVFDRNTTIAYFNHTCDTFSFTTSLTLAYMMNGRFVGYLPIEYHERVGQSKVRLFRDSLRTLQYIVEALVYFNPLKAFLLLSAILGAGAMLSFGLGAVIKINAFYYFGVGGLMLAVLTMCMGFLAVLLKQIMLQSGGEALNKSRSQAKPDVRKKKADLPNGART